VPCPLPQVRRVVPGEDSMLGNFADIGIDYAKVRSQSSLLATEVTNVRDTVSCHKAQSHVKHRRLDLDKK
jgi:hypothetical protein